ncbi:MAG: hypothetical protein GXO43_03885 [Crenarchaeota archaeon]|nr:hypothetical protein [Thermoproteota archaeon]
MDLPYNIPYTIEMDIARIKERLRSRDLNKSSATLAVALMASIKGWWISSKEITEALREIGYNISKSVVNTTLYKESKRGIIKSKRLGRTNAYKIDVEDIDNLGMVTKRILYDEVRDYVISDLLSELTEATEDTEKKEVKDKVKA